MNDSILHILHAMVSLFFTLGLIQSTVGAIIRIIKMDPPRTLSGHTAWQTKGMSVGRQATAGHSRAAEPMLGEQSEGPSGPAPCPTGSPHEALGGPGLWSELSASAGHVLPTGSHTDGESSHPGQGTWRGQKLTGRFRRAWLQVRGGFLTPGMRGWQAPRSPTSQTPAWGTTRR